MVVGKLAESLLCVESIFSMPAVSAHLVNLCGNCLALLMWIDRRFGEWDEHNVIQLYGWVMHNKLFQSCFNRSPFESRLWWNRTTQQTWIFVVSSEFVAGHGLVKSARPECCSLYKFWTVMFSGTMRPVLWQHAWGVAGPLAIATSQTVR